MVFLLFIVYAGFTYFLIVIEKVVYSPLLLYQLVIAALGCLNSTCHFEGKLNHSSPCRLLIANHWSAIILFKTWLSASQGLLVASCMSSSMNIAFNKFMRYNPENNRGRAALLLCFYKKKTKQFIIWDIHWLPVIPANDTHYRLTTSSIQYTAYNTQECRPIANLRERYKYATIQK